MIERSFSLNVITPEKVVYSNEVASVTAHGSDGYLGVLAQHAPLITTLEPGLLSITEPDEKKVTFSVNKGIMEVRKNKVVVLADAVEKS
ncbi:MAG: ATP synthase F1 subunit epsilon [Planctomycetes bacterium RIFCSPLOWO2_12_FULL_40_19]|nr:MAG: ATP synthase F1 subunit epsilon [Planctomycetes bacterium RIFCSPLOWO2_12_FULL_40_19]